MSIIIFDSKRYTDVARETMEHLIYYVNKSVPITLLSENCAILVRSKCTEKDEVIKAYERQAKSVVNSMPDFSKYIMDDGCGMIWLTNGDAVVLIPEANIVGKEEISLGMALEYRGMGLGACEDNDVIALFIPDEQ